MFTTVEIAEVTGGKLLGGSVTVTGVSTDTRTIAPGMLFVAIRGESFDGNDYIGAAVIEMGMSGLGEISVLSKAAAPDICIITNIGWCHIENYPEGKARDTRRRFCGGSADTQRRRRVSENCGYPGQEDSPVRQGR